MTFSLTAMLLTFARPQLVTKALVLARKLHSSLRSLAQTVAGGGTPPPAAFHLAADLHALADQLAALVCTKRAHIKETSASAPLAAGGPPAGPVVDPRILVFEFCAGVVLRAQQVALLSKLAAHATSGHSVCHQMLMGEGKTTVISPLLALLLADGRQLVFQVVPAPLFRFTLQVMGSVFRIGPLRKPVCTFHFDRRSEVSDLLLISARIAIEERAVMVSTPAAVKAFMLKLIELLHLLDIGEYPRMHGALGKIARKIFGLKLQPAGVSEHALNKPALLAQVRHPPISPAISHTSRDLPIPPPCLHHHR